MSDVKVTELGYLGLSVSNVAAWKQYAAEVVGMQVVDEGETDRFYLRGLAKELGLSISPLRRELNQLERSGMLRAVHEGNIRFYTVDPTSPGFLQLKQAGQTSGSSVAPLEPPAHAIPVGVISAGPQRPLPTPSTQRHGPGIIPLGGPALVGAAVLGMALMLIVASLAYLTMTNDRLASAIRRVLTTRAANVTVVAPQPAASSGVMRGRRWQVVPGGFGGFSTSASQESY